MLLLDHKLFLQLQFMFLKLKYKAVILRFRKHLREKWAFFWRNTFSVNEVKE